MVRNVTDEFRSITEHSNIQPFLESKFLFRKACCSVNIQYTKWLKFIINLRYPFRKIIKHRKIKALMNMESIRRGH